MKLYRGEHAYLLPIDKGRLFVKTGEFRPPTYGEFYLSGAIPQAYKAFADLSTAYWIMRPATREETHCALCGALRTNLQEG